MDTLTYVFLEPAGESCSAECGGLPPRAYPQLLSPVPSSAASHGPLELVVLLLVLLVLLLFLLCLWCLS
jgi:hypothetical protein